MKPLVGAGYAGRRKIATFDEKARRLFQSEEPNKSQDSAYLPGSK